MKRLFAVIAWALLQAAMAQAQQLTVSAAASLNNAFREIGARFEAAHPGVTLRFNFAASGVLLQQIDQGAPVDVFASADEETMRRGIERKLLDGGTRSDFASNALVLVAPQASNVKGLDDLRAAEVKRIAVGKPALVPAGRYARQALTAAGLWTALEPRFVYAENVRQVLDYVARGEVDAGFVYRTDAMLAADKLRVVQVLAGHDPVRYPAAVVVESRNKTLAAEFIAFLSAPAARDAFVRHGFSVGAP